MRMLGDGSYAIDDAVEIPGEGVTPFVFCTGWLLEIVEIESGEYAFIRDGQRIEPAGVSGHIIRPSLLYERLSENSKAGFAASARLNRCRACRKGR